MVVLAALGAALAYAVASVFQQHAAEAAPDSEALRMRLLVRLVGRPLWLVGIAADVAGYVLQFIALGHGSLVLVQPLLVCGLLFALPLGALLSRRRFTRGDGMGSAAVVAGLALFLVVANPGSGSSTASSVTWVMVSIGTAGPAALLVWWSNRRTGAVRASLQATAAGALYGLSAALTKTVAAVVTAGGGVTHVVYELAVTWQTWALVATGIIGLLLSQSAFQAGPLGWSLPALTVVDPVVSIIIGAVAFGEPVNDAPAAVLAEAVGLVLMIVGVTVLARSPLVPHAEEPSATAPPPG